MPNEGAATAAPVAAIPPLRNQDEEVLIAKPVEEEKLPPANNLETAKDNGLIQRPSVQEFKAVELFIADMSFWADQHGDQIIESIRKHFPDQVEDLHPVRAKIDFSLLAIATGFQAVKNMCSPIQAERMRWHVVNTLISLGSGETLVDGFKEYDDAWGESLRENTHPFGPLTSTLCSRLEISPPGSMGFFDPIFILMVGQQCVLAAPPWWKHFLKTFQLVP